MKDKKDKLEGKFVAQCMNGKMQMAMSNRGHLLPCCWCDQEWTLSTPLFQKMLKVSKVSEAENVDEIVLSDESTMIPAGFLPTRICEVTFWFFKSIISTLLAS